MVAVQRLTTGCYLILRERGLDINGYFMVMIGKKYQLTQFQELKRFEMCLSNIICECNKQTIIYITLDHIAVILA